MTFFVSILKNERRVNRFPQKNPDQRDSTQ
jgi:hypothetical protein